jgi:hypothetical protein
MLVALGLYSQTVVSVPTSAESWGEKLGVETGE